MVEVYSTCPSSRRPGAEFRRRVAEVARWSDSAGLRGLLVFTDNRVIDPWALAQYVIERTRQLVPLVAVQPMYMHPYNAARMVSTIAYLYDRPVDLNLVTGGSRSDFLAVGCLLDHDDRYRRLVEFAQIMMGLLTEPEPVTHHGEHYRLDAATLRPTLPVGLRPRYHIAGSSPACLAAAQTLNVPRLLYPLRVDEYVGERPLAGTGIRVGIIARETTEEAWQVARRRYPRDPLGELQTRMAAPDTQPQWWHGLLQAARRQREERETYWLYPFRASGEYCPFLVGSYAEVGEVVSRYLDLGAGTIILNAPWIEEDLHHAMLALQHATALSTAGTG